MNKTILAGSAALLLSLTSPVWAGSDSGLYIGGSVGSAATDVSYSDPSIGDINYDDDDSSYKVFFGYNFGVIPLLNLAIEGSYVDLGAVTGSVSGNTVETSHTAYDAFGLVGLNLGPFELFGKAGMAAWDSEAKVQSTTTDDSGTDPVYGLGAQFQLGSAALRAEFEFFDLENADIGLFSVGASYTF